MFSESNKEEDVNNLIITENENKTREEANEETNINYGYDLMYGFYSASQA